MVVSDTAQITLEIRAAWHAAPLVHLLTHSFGCLLALFLATKHVNQTSSDYYGPLRLTSISPCEYSHLFSLRICSNISVSNVEIHHKSSRKCRPVPAGSQRALAAAAPESTAATKGKKLQTLLSTNCV